MKNVSASIAFMCVTLVVCVAMFFATNWAVEKYLRANPDILMTRDERINENTRSVREKLIPKDKITEWYALDSADELKGLWDEYYNAGAEFESYVHFRARPVEGKYYGVTQAGYRKVRDQGPWPPEDGNFNLFFFGGSTSFGVGPYWATIASYLQDRLNETGAFGRPVRVYNFGRSGYMSGQEIILFQRLLTEGHVPNMVVFLDGLNDFCWIDGQPSSWQALASYFNSTNDAARKRAMGDGIVTEWGKLASFLQTLPLSRYLNASLAKLTEEPEPQYTAPAKAVDEKPEHTETLNRVINRYLSFKKQVEGISAAFNIQPVFVWQPIPTYKYDASYHLFYPNRLGCHVNSKFGYPMMAERVARLGRLGSNFIWLADMQEALKKPLYIDAFHYTAPMSRRIAAALADAVVARNLVGARSASAGQALPATR